jgi:chaperonin GroES
MNDLAAFALPEDAAPIDEAVDPNEAPAGEDVVTTESALDKLKRWADEALTDNIGEELDAGLLSQVGMKVVEEFGIDEKSREQWFEEAKTARELALQRQQPKTFPWPGASNVVLPIMTEGADQFAARAYPAIVSDRGVVKGVASGKDDGIPLLDPATGQPIMDPQTQGPKWKVAPGEVQRRADRIGEHMSWQLLEEQPEWEEETDKMMHILPIVGCAFRKTYFDPDLGRNCSVFVSALDVVIDYWAKSMATAPRISEILRLYPYQIEEYKRSGYFDKRFDVKYEAASNDPDAPHVFIEQHRRLDLDDDGYAEPYIVTVHKETMQVARITARYDLSLIHISEPTRPCH